MEAHDASPAESGEAPKDIHCQENDTEHLQLANNALQEENQRLNLEIENLRKQLEQYKLVSESFEKRVLDLQKESKKTEDELAALKKTENGAQNSFNHNRHDVAVRSKELTSEDSTEPEQFRKLFIGGLNYSTTDESLREYFSKFGELVDCVVMKDSATNRSRGFGFVVYSQVSMVDAAQAARPHLVDGREVETKRAVPKGEPLHRENQIRVKKIFVGGLKDTTDESVLSDYFSQFGHVDHVDLIKDRMTKRLRGFAYISFNDYDPVDKAVLQKYHTIDGRRCEVKKALSKIEMRSLKGDGGFDGPASGVGGGGGVWPSRGVHCAPVAANAGGNMCGSFGPNCNVGGFNAGCGFGGPNVGNFGGNMNHRGGWNQCGGGWNQCGPNNWCADGFHGWQRAEKFNGGNFHGKCVNNVRCNDHLHPGGGCWAGDMPSSSSSHRGGGGVSSQRVLSPPGGGYVSD